MDVQRCGIHELSVINLSATIPTLLTHLVFCRYFVNFLLYIMTACVYGILITASPFIEYVRIQQEQGTQFRLGRGYSRKAAVSYTFVLSLSIGLGNVSLSSVNCFHSHLSFLSRNTAVGILLAWHIYLIGTAQTTIEFYGNTTRAHRARLRGLKYQNP